MGYPPYLTRLYNYQQLKNAGLDTVPDPAKLDVELNAIIAAYNALAKRERAYTTPSGSLTQIPSAASLSLSSTTRFVATAGQTSFVVPTYSNTTDTVEVWTGPSGSGMTMLDPNTVARTDTTHVTIAGQQLGTIVVILIFSSGSATLATLAIDGTSGGTSGASLIGFFGSGLFTSHTVEAALVEFRTTYNAFISALGSVGNVLRADGSVALAANLPAGGHKITGLASGTVAGDSVEYSQFASFASVWNTLQAYYAKLDGTTPWTGNWDAGNHQLKNLAAGTSPNDAITLSQFNVGSTQTGKNAVTNGLCTVAQGTDYAASVSGTFGYGKTDQFIGALVGATVAGTLTQGSASPPGTSGYSVKWSAVTLTGGTGQVKLRHYIESINSLRFIQKQGYFGVNVKHSCLSSINVTVNVYVANAPDNFSGGMTLIGSVTQSIVPATDTRITMTPLASGIATAGSGVCFEVVFTTGDCTAISCEAADWQAETGGYSQIEFETYSLTAARCRRYFTHFGAEGVVSSQFLGAGFGNSTSSAQVAIILPVRMRTMPTLAASSSPAANFSLYAPGSIDALNSMSIESTFRSSSDAVVLTCGTPGATLTNLRSYWLECGGSDKRLDFDARLT